MSHIGKTAMRWLPALALMAVIFVLSSISGLRVSDDVQVERPIRVVAHLGTYALLAGLLLYALCGLRRPRAVEAWAAFGLTLLFAASDEIHQSFVPGRTGRFDDIVVDAIGALIGIAVAYAVLSFWATRRGRRDG